MHDVLGFHAFALQKHDILYAGSCSYPDCFLQEVYLTPGCRWTAAVNQKFHLRFLKTPASRARAEVLFPVPPAGYPRKPGDPILLIPAPTFKNAVSAMSPAPSLIHSALGNLAFAMSLISLVIFIICFAMTWLTVLRDARLIKDQVLPNVTGVSLPFCFNGVCY